MPMIRALREAAAVVLLLAAALSAGPAQAQKQGGTLRLYHRDSPASVSLLEEATISVLVPMMGVFNNLVVFDPKAAQQSLAAIVPDLAESWSWSEDGKDLVFKLRHGVTWHDGKPFTAADVRCTWDLLLGRGTAKLRLNPRRSWWDNVAEVTAEGNDTAIFHLKRPQPALLALLASGLSPIYPCHVSPAQMRQHPIGTGPFKFVEFKPNESIRVARNPDYWKPGRPYLDGIEYTIIPNRSTAILAFVAGKFDMTYPYQVTMPLLKQVREQMPDAVCEVRPTNGTNALLNHTAPPFDNPDLRRAVALSLDRKALIDMLTDGEGTPGAAMLPPPEGLWGLPQDELAALPGYGPDVEKNRTEARAIMQKLGYGPDKPLAVKIMTRNAPVFRDPAVALTDQLKQIYINGELDLVETAQWYPKLARKDYTIAYNLTERGVDDPDQQFFENYACSSDRNYTGYCDGVMDDAFVRQSIEPDQARRQGLVWQIQKQLEEQGARITMYYSRGATCWQPQVKGVSLALDSIYNSWRFEDVWLDR
ncbi:MAG: ABC transporter substrate-binding protein [Alphaproteobacteria bacterium]|nr:ABC transporter substrate-binding protein [Alphaproteobacteria bacterium]